MQSHMPSSDTNLHHLTTKGLLLICGAHSPWLTAWHAEGITGKECGEERRPARITHTYPNTNIFTQSHIDTDILLSLAGWTKLPTYPPSFMLKRHLCTCIVNAKESHPRLCWCCPRGSWNSSGRGAERDKENRGRAHYGSEDNSCTDFHLCWTHMIHTHTVKANVHLR